MAKLKTKTKLKFKPVKTCKQQDKPTREDRYKNGQFKKGVSGNPKGCPAGSSKRQDLVDAIRRVETKKGKKWLEHQIRKSYEDTTLAIAILARLHPSLKALEMSGAVNTSVMSPEEALKIQEELKKQHA